ncbi:MAG: SpoVR family protein [Halobacteria archaeon]|nr:SpoVR family protein [Halobacteria archaeon]
MRRNDVVEKRREAEELEEPVEEARALAEKLGLDPYPVKYWIVDYDEVNRAVAYGGFQERYPHWRWGMKYDRQRKQNQYTPSRIYELVVNDDPAHAYLQISNNLADQKAVITHVEAHADFFKNNRWFREMTGETDAAASLSRNAEEIKEYMQDPDVSREEVERWIDNVLCIEDNIDQHGGHEVDVEENGATRAGKKSGASEVESFEEKIDEMDISDEVREEVFDDEWLERRDEDGDTSRVPEEPEKDLLRFLAEHGMAYDDKSGKAVEFEDWQRDVIEILRNEAYYFAPQKMTKVMNEGWSAYWESMMMGEEAFAGDDEFLEYADHQARVLSSGGMNPYKLGKELWEYVENKTNREEVIEKLLKVEGITVENFHDTVDFDEVHELLLPEYPLDEITHETVEDLERLDDSKVDRENLDRALQGEVDLDSYPWKVLSYEGLAERHFSLTKPQNRSFLRDVSREDVEEIGRYVFDDAVYGTVEEAVGEVDYTVGWDKMRQVRETHNDVTFIDSFLTQEFVDNNSYFTYEYSHATGQYHAASTEYEDVKKKLMLEFTNFGKPTIKVHDANYNNAGELLLAHHYNGVMLDLEQAEGVLERVHEMWGRPVNLKTIVKEIDDNVMKMAKRRGREPEANESGYLIRYDGDGFERKEIDWEEVEEIAATEIDYDTKPEEWLT